jgi:enoyl-CoA hydratase/carnithine racemase
MPGADEVIQLDRKGPVVTVSLNRPGVLNAISMELLEQLVRVFDELRAWEGVRCVVLKGNGRAFSVGADQKERPNMTLEDVRRRRRMAPNAFGAMRDCPFPVVAQVHGYALGGGLELALNCDLIVVSMDTVMGLVETQRGSIPGGGGTQLLPRLIGYAKAKELIFTGRTFTGAEAAEWGLANYAVPAADLASRTDALVQEVASAAPISCVQAKLAIDASMDLSVRNGVLHEAALYERILTTADRAEALNAFKENREPDFRGE